MYSTKSAQPETSEVSCTSTSTSSNSHVAKHIHVEQPDQTVKMDIARIPTTEVRWFGRREEFWRGRGRGGGMKESIQMKVVHLYVKRDGERYSPLGVKQHH